MLKKYEIAILIAVMLSILFSGCSERGGILGDSDKEIAIQGIDKIAQRLNNYFVQKGEYPEDVMQLKEEGFLSRFPQNPYFEGNKGMIPVKVAVPSAGDFSYIKIYRDAGSSEIMYYILILWGPRDHKGEDFFDASFDYDTYKFTTWDIKPDGTPDRHLKMIKSELQLKTAEPGEEEG
jgi:hypothetical protein